MKSALLVIVLSVLFFSCTEQQRAKMYGGTANIKLKPNRKLVNCTFKDANIWLLTKPMKPTDSSETYEFVESSNYGILSGTVIIEETKQ